VNSRATKNDRLIKIEIINHEGVSRFKTIRSTSWPGIIKLRQCWNYRIFDEQLRKRLQINTSALLNWLLVYFFRSSVQFRYTRFLLLSVSRVVCAPISACLLCDHRIHGGASYPRMMTVKVLLVDLGNCWQAQYF